MSSEKRHRALCLMKSYGGRCSSSSVRSSFCGPLFEIASNYTSTGQGKWAERIRSPHVLYLTHMLYQGMRTSGKTSDIHCRLEPKKHSNLNAMFKEYRLIHTPRYSHKHGDKMLIHSTYCTTCINSRDSGLNCRGAWRSGLHSISKHRDIESPSHVIQCARPTSICWFSVFVHAGRHEQLESLGAVSSMHPEDRTASRASTMQKRLSFVVAGRPERCEPLPCRYTPQYVD